MKRLAASSAVLAAILGGSLMAAEAPPSYGASACQAALPGAHGAGLDGDGDGVADSEDRCLRTPAGTRVGMDGCAAGEVHVSCGIEWAEPEARVVPAAPGEFPAGEGD